VTYFYEKPTNTYFVLDLLYKSVALRTTISKMGSSHPDADLYPRATGAAARLVEAHSKEGAIKTLLRMVLPVRPHSWTIQAGVAGTEMNT
jgi:hypothetical protein